MAGGLSGGKTLFENNEQKNDESYQETCTNGLKWIKERVD